MIIVQNIEELGVNQWLLAETILMEGQERGGEEGRGGNIKHKKE